VNERAAGRAEDTVVVVGSGVAGITAALTAAGHGLRVVMITKDLIGGASPLAQGGLAAALGPCDSPRQHALDTVTAGVGLCDPETVAALADGSPGAIDWLVTLGARLERRDLRLEGGHSQRRIVHSGDDASGAEVHRTLLAALGASRVEVRDRMIALDLTAGGLLAARIGPGGEIVPELITAGAVVLATGGLGQAFATTSNPAGATGDAIAIASRAGAVLRDLEFVQFHPTVLWSKGATGQRPLVTEALRGAGAVLRDLAGNPVMAGRHPLGDLAPRDIVAAGMFEVMERDGCEHLLLDATRLGRGQVEEGFPTVTAACRADGIDPAADLIPVAPGAHYSCGGIATDMAGRTSVAGLYAIGEAASTGVHGANRLASNSLVEAVLMGRNAAEAIAVSRLRGRDESRGPGGRGPAATGPLAAGDDELAAALARAAAIAGGPVQRAIAAARAAAATDGPVQRAIAAARAAAATDGPVGGTAVLARGRATGGGPVQQAIAVARAAAGGNPAVGREELATAMSRHAGVVRDADGLCALLRLATSVPSPGAAEEGAVGLGERTVMPPVRAGEIEAANLRTVSVLIAAAALARTESRGCHRRRDAPETWARARHTLVRQTA
jgi:L-aspartate oxidase